MKIYIVKKCQFLTMESIFHEEILSLWLEHNDAIAAKAILEGNNDKSWITYDIGIYTVEEKRSV